jgi:hypothetical protein
MIEVRSDPVLMVETALQKHLALRWGMTSRRQFSFKPAASGEQSGFCGVIFWRDRSVIGKRKRITFDIACGWQCLHTTFQTSDKPFGARACCAQFRLRPVAQQLDRWWAFWPSSDVAEIVQSMEQCLDSELGRWLPVLENPVSLASALEAGQVSTVAYGKNASAAEILRLGSR